MQLLDVLNHLFQRGRIVAVAGKDLVAYRHPAPAHHQSDVDLFAVRTMIPRVAPLRQPIDLRFPFKISAGHVIEQQVVLQRKQLAQLLPAGAFPASLYAAAAHPVPGTTGRR